MSVWAPRGSAAKAPVSAPSGGHRAASEKRRYAVEDYFDVWLPNLAPSAQLMRLTKHSGGVDDAARWRRFAARYRTEMNKPDALRVLESLAALSSHANFSVGCYREDDRRCHRSILREILREHGAKISAR